jgi:hypothetical protein
MHEGLGRIVPIAPLGHWLKRRGEDTAPYP